MIESMREEFEAWAKTRSLSLVTYAGGMYVCDKTMWAEIAWTESRAALCVELPSDRSLSASDDPWYAKELCEEAIHAAGVKTK